MLAMVEKVKKVIAQFERGLITEDELRQALIEIVCE